MERSPASTQQAQTQCQFVTTAWRSADELLELRRWFFDREGEVDGRRAAVDKVCLFFILSIFFSFLRILLYFQLPDCSTFLGSRCVLGFGFVIGVEDTRSGKRNWTCTSPWITNEQLSFHLFCTSSARFATSVLVILYYLYLFFASSPPQEVTILHASPSTP